MVQATSGSPTACVSAGVACSGASGQPHKARLRWTPELHTRFLAAANTLGGPEVATPKQILVQMEVPGASLLAGRGPRGSVHAQPPCILLLTKSPSGCRLVALCTVLHVAHICCSLCRNPCVAHCALPGVLLPGLGTTRASSPRARKLCASMLHSLPPSLHGWGLCNFQHPPLACLR